MKLGDLTKWGIPSQVIKRWEERQGVSLLPVQNRAIRKGLIGLPMEGNRWERISMLISAPTSSGKSFCAELAAIRALTSRQKTVMLFPLKSLAEEKYRQFLQTYGPLGIKCLIVTGDHPENDRAFSEGDYRIAVCIYEKFDMYLTNSLDNLKNIGLVVIDEIQTITEPGRGAILERLLTKMLASVYRPSLLGLSAVIGDDASSAGTLASWLGADLIEETIRPVELKRGVVVDGKFRYKLFNEGDDGVESFAKTVPGESAFDAFTAQIKNDSGSTLVFLKSRMETVEYAYRLASAVDWSEAKKALALLEDEEPSFLIRSLRQALSRGVAFHNSDLTQKQRDIIEQAFVKKEIKAIFSTTTLAMGVNLAADNVYLETVKYEGGKYNGKPSLVPVSRCEFDNMTGRAGRFDGTKKMNGPGRAVIMAESEFESDILWKNYIDIESAAPIKSVFESMPLEDWLLNMICCGLIRENSPEFIGKVYSRTLYSLTGDSARHPDFESAFEKLLSEKFITTNYLTITPTRFGQAVAKTGLPVSGAVYYRNKLDSLSTGYPESESGWVALALSGTDWSLPPGILSRYELGMNKPVRMLYRQFDHLLSEARLIVGQSSEYSSKPLDYRTAASLKAFLLLEKWRNLTPVQKLEEQFQVHLGQITGLGETAAHLVLAIGEMIQAENRDSCLKEKLSDCAFSLRYGLPVSFKELHRYFGDILNRADYALLEQANLDSLSGFCSAGPETLRLLFSRDVKLKNINDKIEKVKQEVQMNPNTETIHKSSHDFNPAMFIRPESIEIEGTYQGERYLVKINGFPLRLTGKSFKYFTKLAWSRLYAESGWIYKDDIEQGFNQARYLYRMKGEINGNLNGGWSIVENNRLGYYRLDVDPSKIKINIDNLKNHPDYELRILAESASVN